MKSCAPNDGRTTRFESPSQKDKGQNFRLRLTIFAKQQKKRIKRREAKQLDTQCVLLCLVFPPGALRGGTHTQELRFSLRSIDTGLELVLSVDKCPCDVCYARVSAPIFYSSFVLYFVPQNFFSAKTRFSCGRKENQVSQII